MRVDEDYPKMLDFGIKMRRHFALSPDIAYLNHGAFGAVPNLVRDAQREIQQRMEWEPSRFF